MNKMVFSISLCAMLALAAHSRPWTANGRTVEADLFAYEPGRNVVWLKLPSRENPYEVKLSILDDASREYVLAEKGNLTDYNGILMTDEAVAIAKKRSGKHDMSKDAKTSGRVPASVSPIDSENHAIPTMSCKLIKTDSEDRNTGWHSMYSGKPVRVKMKAMTYELSVKNIASTNETYQIYWYVIGENNYQQHISIVESNNDTLECASGRTVLKHLQTQYYISQKVSSKQENFANLSNMNSFKDIIIQLVRNGKVVRFYVSNKKYEKEANNLPFSLPK